MVYVHMVFWRFHLREVDAEGVGVVLPADLDLGLRVPAFPLDFRTTGQGERRLLGDQLKETQTRTWGKNLTDRDRLRTAMLAELFPLASNFYART